MQNAEMIRRWWSGFGECRITVAPFTPSAPVSGSIVAKAFACVPRLFSRIGLGSLSFTVDPAWILQEGKPPASPIVLQFLRVHRKALAEEWKSRQPPHSAPPPPSPPRPAPLVMPLGPPSTMRPAPPAAPKPQGPKGLPSWFGHSCAPGEASKRNPLSHEEPVKQPEASV
jgi:hypothetical protein